MAYNEVILAMFIVLAILGIFIVVTTTSLRKEYKRGWDDSKRVYYDDLNEERLKAERLKEEKEAEQRMLLDKENREHLPITSELLMAYGVSTVGGLPKSVREAYNISDKYNSIDLDTLANMEMDKEV